MRRVSEYEGGVIHDREGYRHYNCIDNHGRSTRAGRWFKAAICEQRERPCDEDGSLSLLSRLLSPVAAVRERARHPVD